MKRRSWLIVLGAAGVTAAATGCKDQTVRDYLAKDGRMYTWQRTLSRAVCQLEEKNPTGLDPTKRICPNGEGGGGDKTPPPSYP
jgi:hypothetical protein